MGEREMPVGTRRRQASISNVISGTFLANHCVLCEVKVLQTRSYFARKFSPWRVKSSGVSQSKITRTLFLRGRLKNHTTQYNCLARFLALTYGIKCLKYSSSSSSVRQRCNTSWRLLWVNRMHQKQPSAGHRPVHQAFSNRLLRMKKGITFVLQKRIIILVATHRETTKVDLLSCNADWATKDRSVSEKHRSKISLVQAEQAKVLVNLLHGAFLLFLTLSSARGRN